MSQENPGFPVRGENKAVVKKNFLISDQAGVLFLGGGGGALIKGAMWEIETVWCYSLSEMSYQVFVFLIWTKHIAQS